LSPGFSCEAEGIGSGEPRPSKAETGYGSIIHSYTFALRSGWAVVQAVISRATGADALALSTILDGAGLSAGDPSSADLRGWVKYAAPVGGTTTVYIYVTHR
jgi:hypothetical protein